VQPGSQFDMVQTMGALSAVRSAKAPRPLPPGGAWNPMEARMPFRAAQVPVAQKPARVAFLLLSGFAMLSYAVATECLRAANQVRGARLYEWFNVSPDGESVTASNGLAFHCDFDTQSAEPFDYVFVCASDEVLAFDHPPTLRWLRAHAKLGTMMGGISGGTFLLARAGLLEHRRVTLHWVYMAAFAEEFPTADVRQSLFEIDGNRLTCGGGTAALDMLHQLLLREHGKTLADNVSDWFLQTDIREGEKPQRLSPQARLGVSHAGLGRALEAMEGALEEPLSRDEIADIARVSKRQLDRLFVSQVGRTMNVYYLDLRLKRAQQLVRQSALSQLEITYACGFKSPSSFCKAYRAEFGVPPSKDRTRSAASIQGLATAAA
jgi:transcriptional regulator GlxA family with amidase domain